MVGAVEALAARAAAALVICGRVEAHFLAAAISAANGRKLAAICHPTRIKEPSHWYALAKGAQDPNWDDLKNGARSVKKPAAPSRGGARSLSGRQLSQSAQIASVPITKAWIVRSGR